jgi:recombination protein RecA
MTAAKKKVIEDVEEEDAPKKGKKGKKKLVTLRDKMELIKVKGGSRLDELKILAKTVNGALGTAGAVYLGHEQREFERVPTGIVALDYVLGGGLVRGQMVQFTGEDSSAKTTAAMVAVGTAQAKGLTCVWVAGEGFDKHWARKLGIDLEDMVVITADTGDTAMEAAVTLVQQGLVDVMVLDSFQSLGTTREMDSGVDDEAYAGAGAPQMWGRVMRKWYSAMNAGANTALIGISQVRAPIGKFSPRGQPEPEGTGIWALKHWKCADVYFKKGELFYDGDASEKRVIHGREFKVKCVKNKTAVSERIATFNLKYDNKVPYIDNAGTAMRLGYALGVIQVKGAYYSYGDLRIKGRENFESALELDDEALESIAEAVQGVLTTDGEEVKEEKVVISIKKAVKKVVVKKKKKRAV